ncbi:oxidoreductase [Bacillus salipaludis]|uniref:FAD-dependent oxidoreductase n=1 Tax=Bacillus salipaludis TaxID=2547811 RepID=A0AA90QRJ8_9BACI|nr:FAD-dependent oxidoreductase [Bacillus salipaludis]MDQ6594909.1 FAD-dependent oxidoreductase [Bacillus salipaludis]
MSQFKYLFTPIKIGPHWIKNRILSTGHMTTFVKDNLPTDQFIAYHEERAKGGAGLIVIEANAVHWTAAFTSHTIMAYTDEMLPYYKKLAEAVHPHGTKMFVQLFHPGREVFPSGGAIAVAPSSIPNDRFRVMPKELEVEEIQEIINGYVETAERVKKGGLDGVEIVASHGYLISQFWSSRLNLRTDQYGGSFENRLRFLKEIIEGIRQKVGSEIAVGMRVSVDDYETNGSTFEEVKEILVYIEKEIGGLDYFNLTGGSSATLMSSIFIAPPSPVPPAHFSAYSGKMRELLSTPVFVNSRINDPVMGEKVLESGQADMVGMTRSLICDPHMPNKAMREEMEKIRYCIGCNQGCIGHMHNDLPITCIQNPVTGRELQFAHMSKAKNIKTVIVIGGGPSGMKAAVIAAERGHKVTLFEKEEELGGQVKLARKIPGREEFGELVANLKRELAYHRVVVKTNTNVTKELILSHQPDEVIVATGATPYIPNVSGIHLPSVITAWDVLMKKEPVGKKVIVADWKGDMPGIGVAIYLAEQGHEVELISACYQVGYGLQQYVRDVMLSKLHLLEVKMTPQYNLHRVEAANITFENIYTGQMLVRNQVDTLVLATGNQQVVDIYYQLKGSVPSLHRIGDCMLPRTVEEAILEGFEVAANL